MVKMAMMLPVMILFVIILALSESCRNRVFPLIRTRGDGRLTFVPYSLKTSYSYQHIHQPA